MTHDPPLAHRQTEAFRAVGETAKITAAADVLGTTQPAISKMIADLERARISIVEPATAKHVA